MDIDRAQLDRIEALLRTLVAQRQKTPRTINDADRTTLAALLPGWFEATKGSACRANEIVAFAPPMMSSKALGKLLARAEGIAIGGLMVERLGTEGHVALWRAPLVEF